MAFVGAISKRKTGSWKFWKSWKISKSNKTNVFGRKNKKKSFRKWFKF